MLEQISTQSPVSRDIAIAIAEVDDTSALADIACQMRDASHHNVITYSKKVFIPLTHLCRDVCHYCTFAKTPKRIVSPYMPVDQVLELCREAAALGCQEALFTSVKNQSFVIKPQGKL